MNLLTGLFIGLCLLAFVSAEGNRSRRQNFKVFNQRRLNPDNLGRRGNYGDDFKEETISLSRPPPLLIRPGTLTATPSSPTTSSAQPTKFNNYKKDKDYLEYDQLVNSFDQDELDDMIEMYRPRRRKNRRQPSRHRHNHRQ